MPEEHGLPNMINDRQKEMGDALVRRAKNWIDSEEGKDHLQEWCQTSRGKEYLKKLDEEIMNGKHNCTCCGSAKVKWELANIKE